jgi:hypothetical protein
MRLRPPTSCARATVSGVPRAWSATWDCELKEVPFGSALLRYSNDVVTLGPTNIRRRSEGVNFGSRPNPTSTERT